MSGTSYRVDETYIEVGKTCKYLYRAKDCKLRRVKYLNNVIGQGHRFVKKKVRASQCFKSFHTAGRTPEGVEAVSMMRKGQVKRLAGSDAQGQAKFVESLYGLAA